MLRSRTLYISGTKTSIALEKVFWETIDSVSGGNWKQWVLDHLQEKPADMGRAMYLRGLAHKAFKTRFGLGGVSGSATQRNGRLIE